MTNKEIASILADKLYSRFVNNAYLKGGNALEGTAEEIIEQDLNDAEKRGAERMREKAAKLVEPCWQPSMPFPDECPGCQFGKGVRALPLEGE